MLIIMGFIVFKADKQFHDRILDIKMGMSEDEVREIMDKDPVSIEYLNDGAYEWIFERKYYKGWGMVTVTTEITFNSEGKVISKKNSESIDDLKKE